MNIKASICTIGDEILIGQIVDTNSSEISRKLGEIGVRVSSMVSISDDHDDIIDSLTRELKKNDIVITTGGLGPTKDDITKPALAELSGSTAMVENKSQLDVITAILHSRGLDLLDINRAQASVPDTCEVITNKCGTAPIMVFRFGEEKFGHATTLYSLPGVPHEAVNALGDIVSDIKAHYCTTDIYHKCVMVYGLAESALAKEIEPWEDALPEDMHLAYLPSLLTGIRLRLSIYGGDKKDQEERIEKELIKLKQILGDKIYSFEDDTLENTIKKLLKGTGKTLSVAESCTGGEISHLITSVSGSSEYYLGSVTSYAVSVKNKILGVDLDTVKRCGVVSSEVAAQMAEGVSRATGSTYAVATTGLADKDGDEHYPGGTVWIGVTGPHGTKTEMKLYKHDRKRNIERFASSALDLLRRYIIEDLNISEN